MTTKAPSFQFYPGDWLRNAISGCPLEAQGLWLRMMIVMHDSETYGQLSINGQPMSDEFIAKKIGISRKKYSNLLQILDEFGVINRKENGIIYSGRMERDEHKRQQNAARQRTFYENHKGEPNAEPNAPPNAKPHTTSSSSSSSSDKKKNISTASRGSRKKKGKTTFPADFSLTAEMRKWFAEHCPRLDADKEFEKFKSRCEANETEYVNWTAGWRTQMLNAEEWFKPTDQSASNSPSKVVVTQMNNFKNIPLPPVKDGGVFDDTQGEVFS